MKTMSSSVLLCSVALSLPIGLCSCAMVGYKKGLSLSPAKPVGSAPKGAGNIRMWDYQSIYTNNPFVEVNIQPSPQERTLLFGPIIPIIPWPPGIFQTISNRKMNGVANEKLKVFITFMANYKDDLGFVTHYSYVPSDARLKIGQKSLAPANIECNPGHKGSQCNVDTNGQYSIVVSTQILAEPKIILTFDENGSDISEGFLGLGSIISETKNFEIPKITIERRRWFTTETIP